MAKLISKEAEVVRLYEEGGTIYTIASHFGVCPVTVWGFLKRRGLNRTYKETMTLQRKLGMDRSRPYRQKFDRQKAIEMYQQGLCMEEIAGYFGCSLSAISKVFHLLGVVRPPEEAHYNARQAGRWIAPLRIGERNPAWKGGIFKSEGYVYVYAPNHPRATRGSKRAYVGQHILVWEEAHNQSVPDGWVVHHLNGIKDDNRVENLVAMPDKKHRTILEEQRKRIRELEQRLREVEISLS